MPEKKTLILTTNFHVQLPTQLKLILYKRIYTLYNCGYISKC